MVSTCTNQGLIRTNNEDTLRTLPGTAPLYVLCDGMGGHRAGEVASALAADTLCQTLARLAPDKQAIAQAVCLANERVFAAAAGNAAYGGMGTTLTALWEGANQFILAHVGDSRAYLLRDGVLRCMSRDHSVVAGLMEQGLITAQQAKTHPYRHMITRAVGTDSTVQPDITVIPKRPGDRWLLCSDGLTDEVEDARLQELLSAPWSDQIAASFVEQALAAGGHDNVSVICVEVSP